MEDAKPEKKPDIKALAKKSLRKGKRNVKHRNPDGSRRSEWEPSPRDLAIYEAVTSGKTQTEVAEEMSPPCTRSNICRVMKAVNKWLSLKLMDEIRETRAEHVMRLLHIHEEAMKAWRNSQGTIIKKIKRQAIDKLGNIHNLVGEEITISAGSPAFLAEARAALDDIRKVCGINKAPTEDPDENEGRVAGRSREQAIVEHIDRLQQTVKAMQQPSRN